MLDFEIGSLLSRMSNPELVAAFSKKSGLIINYLQLAS